MIQRLLTDITGGGLRKQKAAAEAGLMLDDVDIYEDMDDDLIAIRRAAAARRRRLLKAKGGDRMESLCKSIDYDFVFFFSLVITCILI